MNAIQLVAALGLSTDKAVCALAKEYDDYVIIVDEYRDRFDHCAHTTGYDKDPTRGMSSSVDLSIAADRYTSRLHTLNVMAMLLHTVIAAVLEVSIEVVADRMAAISKDAGN